MNELSLIDVQGSGPLIELALDMRWSWNHTTDEMWRTLDPAVWDPTQVVKDSIRLLSTSAENRNK
jgi:Protein of unknown function (DUF3417)